MCTAIQHYTKLEHGWERLNCVLWVALNNSWSLKTASEVSKLDGSSGVLFVFGEFLKWSTSVLFGSQFWFVVFLIFHFSPRFSISFLTSWLFPWVKDVTGRSEIETYHEVVMKSGMSQHFYLNCFIDIFYCKCSVDFLTFCGLNMILIHQIEAYL